MHFGAATVAPELGSSTTGASAPVSLGAAGVGKHPVSSTARAAAVRNGPTGGMARTDPLESDTEWHPGSGLSAEVVPWKRDYTSRACPWLIRKWPATAEVPSIARPTVLSS